MGYGRFVGRVGTLAAALGIGLAVASSPAVAWADTDATAPSASRDDDRTESDRQSRRTQTRQSEKVANAATVEVKRQRGTDIAPDERSNENSFAGLHENEDTDEPIEVTQEVPTRSPSERPEPQPVSPVQLAIEVTPAPETAEEPETEARTLTIAPEPLSAPASPEIPGESTILLAMLAAARRPSTTEFRQVAGIQATELVGAVPNTNPTVTSISARTPGLFTAKVRGRVRATDPDRDKLSYSATAAHGTVTINSWGLYTYTPTAEIRHASAASATWLSDRVNVTVTDGYGGVATTYIDVVIRPKNYRPSARATVAKGNPANGIVTGRINVTDRDGDAVTYTGSGSTSRGTVVVNADGTFVYTPTAAAREAASSIFRRSDRFTVTVNDGHGGIKTVGVRVGIVPPSKNAAPTVGNPSYSITGVNGADGTVTGYVNMADPDGFGLTYSIAAGVAAGTGSLAVNAASGNFTFTPTVGAREHAHGTPGEDTVRFTIAGRDGLSTATVEVTAVISPKAPPPPPPPPSTRMRWPLGSVQVNRYFGGNGHNGIDLHVTMNPRTPVYAAADGVISFEGYGQNHSWMTWAAGICVLVWHPGLNVYSGYAHLSSTVINNGQNVSRGQLIGYAGSTGNSTGPHLHFEVLPRTPNFSNGYSGRIDPLPYLR
ncbi:hypothetical protein CRI77_22085 [Mycolicibacterium duvalii]|uniref:M23ase beta-sheet core domain-containing protein n=1 Tax=Mycolicibacterium duvalii TaxID=39688 RepID=A0A7I7K3C1_9MYCO|nr:Ig-like domain-containing protein [Mycolicibacterium duvalii]MCV7370655.1 peptidoglycan DD-metalloendopeptidase family protein [Mycolicibacterium duvalii]PEG36857.1 hypothetical protein CRI77_22085 [Mycolicibacterium duvalii]BBX17961.1 hypothetical protein MDUV_28210 [Mycolicibacterium duvalii]